MIRAIAPIVFLFSSLALAAGGHGPKDHKKPLGPSAKYSGNSPIDLNNGLLFNNGTFGLENREIEEWATAPVVVPGMSQKHYPYGQKHEIVTAMNEQVAWANAALANYKQTSAETKSEAVEYSKHAIETLSPAVEKLKNAAAKLSSAGSGDWDSAQEEAKRALIDFRLAYTQMHKNSRM